MHDYEDWGWLKKERIQLVLVRKLEKLARQLQWPLQSWYWDRLSVLVLFETFRYRDAMWPARWLPECNWIMHSLVSTMGLLGYIEIWIIIILWALWVRKIRDTSEFLSRYIIECNHAGESGGEQRFTLVPVSRAIVQRPDAEVAKVPIGIFPIRHVLYEGGCSSLECPKKRGMWDQGNSTSRKQAGRSTYIDTVPLVWVQ